MKKTSDFVDYVLYDVLSDDPQITPRKMFGGTSLYYDGLIFAIIVDDKLYFKVDETNKGEYVLMGSEPFTYESKGKKATMSYWEVPQDVMDNPSLVKEWMGASLEVARKSQQKKERKKK